MWTFCVVLEELHVLKGAILYFAFGISAVPCKSEEEKELGERES